MKDFSKGTYSFLGACILCYFSIGDQTETKEFYKIGRRAPVTFKEFHKGDTVIAAKVLL